MKTISGIIVTLALVTVTGLLAGCATPALWKSTAARNWKPSSPDQLFYLPTRADNPTVVVVFRQCSKSGDQYDLRPVAWCPGQSPTNLVAVGMTVDQITNKFRECQPMPLFKCEPTSTNVTTRPPGYGVWDESRKQLTIHLDRFSPGPYSLPASHTEQQTGKRLALLPFAVATDSAITGAVLFILGAQGGCYR